jgi:hypothetical protein
MHAPPLPALVRLVLFAGLLVLPGVSRAQKSAWAPTSVDQHFTVNSPSKPDQLDVPGTMAAHGSASAKDDRTLASRAYRQEDACGVYVLVCVPLFEDPQLPLTRAAREQCYKDRTVPLFISHARGQLLSQEFSSVAGLDVITLSYQVLGATGRPTINFFRQVIVGRTIYQLYFAPADGIGTSCKAQRLKFFNSIRPKV